MNDLLKFLFGYLLGGFTAIGLIALLHIDSWEYCNAHYDTPDDVNECQWILHND